MQKSTLILALVAVTMTAIAAGLWVTRPADMSSQVAVLESKLRESEAVIARLNKQHSATMLSHLPGAGSTASAIGTNDPPMPGSLGSKPGTANGPGQPNSAPPAGTAGAPVVKSDKRLAEAEARYSDLINQFGLQPDEKEAFKNLAAKRDDIRKGVFSKLSDPTLTPAQRQAILADGKAQLVQVDDSMRQFLNNDQDYTTFQNWENQNVERNQMDDARPIFDKYGAPLSPEQETQLNNEGWKLRTNNPALGDPYSADTFVGRRIDQAYVASQLAKFDSDTNILLQNARSYMSQPQITALASMRYQQRVRLESQLWNMARTTGAQ